MIRVLHILPTLGYGGVAKFILHHYLSVNKGEVIFDFVTHGTRLPFHEELEKTGSVIYYLPRKKDVGFLSYFRHFRKAIKIHRDIVHIHLGHYTGLVALICKLLGCRNIICHAHTTRCMNPKHECLMPLFRFLAKYIADLRIACGHDAGVYCFGNARFVEVHNAIDLQLFKLAKIEDVLALRESLGINNSAKVVGHIGAFTPPKNHPYLLRIIDAYVKRNPNSVFVCLGDGENFNKIVDWAKQMGIIDHIRFVGNQDNVPLFLSMFEVFVLPSLHEGLPVVSAEAQAMGLKCLFSDTIDHTCDIGLGILQFIGIQDADINRWCDAIDTPYTKPSHEEVEKKFDEKRYSITSSVNYLLQLYQGIADK